MLHPGQTVELAGGGAFTVARLPNGALGHDGLFGMLKLSRVGDESPADAAPVP
jgi:hypothetical protein